MRWDRVSNLLDVGRVQQHERPWPRTYSLISKYISWFGLNINAPRRVIKKKDSAVGEEPFRQYYHLSLIAAAESIDRRNNARRSTWTRAQKAGDAADL